MLPKSAYIYRRGQNDAVQCVNIIKVRKNQHDCTVTRTLIAARGFVV